MTIPERLTTPILWFCVLLAGAALRLPQLSRRPMHTDEAVHAVKFGSLLEEGYYRYNPVEYHGPTLNYLTLIPAWLAGAKNLNEMNEILLRLVPAFFGLMLIAGLWLLRKEGG
jgi:predicted membrane-bound mannosyltransferase